jgi:hypothetical protein
MKAALRMARILRDVFRRSNASWAHEGISVRVDVPVDVRSQLIYLGHIPKGNAINVQAVLSEFLSGGDERWSDVGYDFDIVASPHRPLALELVANSAVGKVNLDAVHKHTLFSRGQAPNHDNFVLSATACVAWLALVDGLKVRETEAPLHASFRRSDSTSFRLHFVVQLIHWVSSHIVLRVVHCDWLGLSYRYSYTDYDILMLSWSAFDYVATTGGRQRLLPSEF